ncbi:MAG: hypothetical protein IIX85_04545, partial [Clostridia bacterium]|nr:hypothetical protein [Clostridia bacterium]
EAPSEGIRCGFAFSWIHSPLKRYFFKKEQTENLPSHKPKGLFPSHKTGSIPTDRFSSAESGSRQWRLLRSFTEISSTRRGRTAVLRR